jgi:hypothetical protein
MIELLIGKYAQKGILIDTNILLMYVIGSYDKELIPRFKRTSEFAIEDYDTLLSLLVHFERHVATPNILTEVNSLSGQLGEPARSECFKLFAEKVLLIDEQYIESRLITNKEGFIKFGLTDIGIMSLAKGKYLVLTDDFRLSQFLQTRGSDVINFNHVRLFGWS